MLQVIKIIIEQCMKDIYSKTVDQGLKGKEYREKIGNLICLELLICLIKMLIPTALKMLPHKYIK